MKNNIDVSLIVSRLVSLSGTGPSNQALIDYIENPDTLGIVEKYTKANKIMG
jgi:hypothetical protein